MRQATLFMNAVALVVFAIFQAVPQTFAISDMPTYSFVANKNRSKSYYWILHSTKEHILNCYLPKEVLIVDSIEFAWTYKNGSEVNATDVVYQNKTKGTTLSLLFPNITYNIATEYRCISTALGQNGIIISNVTKIFIHVNEQWKQDLIVGLACAGIMLILLCCLGLLPDDD